MKRRRFFALLGSAAGWPFASRAQQKGMPVVGVLRAGAEANWRFSADFRQGLSEMGYLEGQNVSIKYSSAEEYDQLPGLIADLIGGGVDVIATSGMPSAVAVKNAISRTPIVFIVGTDPVAAGLVASLARPDGNLTGLTFMATDLMPKRLELVLELVPQAKVIALLVNPNNASTEPQMRDVQQAAGGKGVRLRILKASTESEIDAAFATLVQLNADALLVGTDPFFFNRREQLAVLAASRAIPAVYEFRDFAAAGGLISYGPSLSDSWRQVGHYVGKILKGAKPADLPIERPTKFELAINLKTAKALGLTLPQSLLTRADEVID
jgi:putative ABC transport system substrate-binding protein